jgi:cytochrome oxidase Cu insertion factor (SCO1/SenC/PrrC family)
MTRLGASLQAVLARLTGSPLFWGAFVFTLFALPLGRSLARTLPTAPVIYGAVEPFELGDQYGHRVGTTQLTNRVWVVTFLGTDASPETAAQIEVVRTIIHRTKNLGAAFRMVTLASDGARDTEGARRAIVEEYCSSAQLWSFLGGTDDELAKAKHGLLAAVGSGPEDQLFLIDTHGRIRGLYGTDKASLDHLMDDVGYVANLP